jgi:hypothetical protein
MAYQHRMPTTRHAMEKDRFNSTLRSMTLEDRIVKRIWNGDLRQVTLCVAMARLAIGRLDQITKLDGDAFGYPPTECDRQLLKSFEARLHIDSQTLEDGFLELMAIDNEPVLGKLPSEDEVLHALLKALRGGIWIDARTALFEGARP